MRIFLGSDPHCGHMVGLTPPGWWTSHEPEWLRVQKAMWKWFEGTVDALKPFDMALWNADMIDGKGERSGSTELITPDRNKQCEMAVQVVKFVGAPENYFSYGTPSHVGTDEDWEDQIARTVGGKIHPHPQVEVEGLIFDIKHKVGGSTIPHGRHTAVAREKLWNVLWAERGVGLKADILARGHVHYHAFCGAPGWLAMTLPALQGFGSKYGARQCSGVVDFGFTVFDVYKGRRYTWQAHTTVLKAFRSAPLNHSSSTT
jgi:hypothetical protein